MYLTRNNDDDNDDGIMGCASSNQGDSKDNNKSGRTNGNAGGEGPNENAAPEPVTPKQNPYISLTPKDVFSLKMSWKGIRRGVEETGTTMFIKMFETNADVKKYFEKFKDMNNELLIKSTILIDHATAVMEMLDTYVTELDDAEKTHNNIKKKGAEHKARGIKEEHLREIRNPFLKAVEQTLGDRYTDRMRNIYEVYIDYVIKTLIEGYN